MSTFQGVNCVIRPNIKDWCHVVPWQLIKYASNSITQVPLPTLFPWIRSFSQTTFLIKGTQYNSHSSLSSRFQFPACLQNYSNKPIIFSHRNQEAPHPLSSKACLPQLWLSLCSQVQPQHGSVWGPPPQGCKYAWLINCWQYHRIAPIQCQVLCF